MIPRPQEEGSSRNFWPLVIIAAITSASAVIYIDSPANEPWVCTPLDAVQTTLPEVPCFRALPVNGNTISLQWRVSGNTESVYIYDDTPPDYADPGFQPVHCPDSQAGACSFETSLEKGGAYRWTVKVSNSNGDSIHASAAVDLATLPPPLVEGGGFVDALEPSDQLFSWEWSPADSADSSQHKARWVELKLPGQIGWTSARRPIAGPQARFQVPASFFDSRGETVFAVRYCEIPRNSTGKYCSPGTPIGYRVGYDHFVGGNNRHVAAGEDLEISFSARAGNFRLLSSDTLLTSDVLTAATGETQSLVIDGGRLTPGSHRLELNSCDLTTGQCSNRVNAAPLEAMGAIWQKRPGYYSEGEVIATLYPADGSAGQSVKAPASGLVHFSKEAAVYLAEKGDSIAYTLTNPADVLRLLVDRPIEWTLDREYTEDFYPGVALPVTGMGQPLDITFDNSGGIWLLNEFSNNVEYVSPQGDLNSLSLPLARRRESVISRSGTGQPPREAFPAVKPFTFWYGPNVGGSTTITSLAEKITAGDSRIWFTQGGGLQKSAAVSSRNHSKVISFDPALENSPKTPYDDRFCVYNMPADDEKGFGNNQIIGLTGARGRIWIAESRGLLNQSVSFLSSFVPDPRLCNNLMDYDDPQALASQVMQYCASGKTPEQDGCMERIPLPSTPRIMKIAHLASDPGGGLIWFTDASGQCLGSYDIDSESGISIREIEDKHAGEFENIADLGGFPWDLEVTDDAVYIGEYASRHILRYDKRSQRYDEVAIPYTGQRVRLHSMAVDPMRSRLWFSLSNECATPRGGSQSTIGYIDLASWRSLIERPNAGHKIKGVIYSGLNSIPACEPNPGAHQSFRGIAIDPQTGKIALATMLREQITLLEPLPGFWP